MAETHLFSDSIRCFETNSPDVVSEPIGVLLNDGDAFIPIGFENLGGMAGADIMALEKEHDVFDFLLLLPAFLDFLYPDFADSRDLYQRIRVFF